jgi:hypothetical protein
MSKIKLKFLLLIAVSNYNASSNTDIRSQTIARKICIKMTHPLQPIRKLKSVFHPRLSHEIPEGG